MNKVDVGGRGGQDEAIDGTKQVEEDLGKMECGDRLKGEWLSHANLVCSALFNFRPFYFMVKLKRKLI